MSSAELRLVSMRNEREGMRTKKLDRETLDDIIRRVVEVAQPERIVLFGSAARGEMGPHSDVDILVVKDCASRRSLSAKIRQNLYRVQVPMDVIVVTPDDVNRFKDTHGLVIKPALKEGTVVYESTSALPV